jgi:hypothetical protein
VPGKRSAWARSPRRQRIGLVAVHEGGYNVSTLPTIDRSIVAGLGGFEMDLDDVFVPDDPAPPAEWPERLCDLIAVQRRFWKALR